MSRYFLIIILMTLHVRIFSQLPNGSPAPDFDVQDVYGNTFSLYAMMGANKSACVGFEAVWCSFCWHFKQSGVLQDVANTLSSQTTIVMMESEFQTNTDCLFGLPTCNDYTWGDWVTGMPFQVADLSSTNGANIATDYNRYTYPLLYVISPDKRTWLIVERTYANYSNWITKSFALNATGTLTHSTCGDNGKIILNVSGGFGAITYKWSNGATTKDLNNIPGGNYTVTITDGNKYFKSFGPFVIDGPSKRVDVTNLELVNVKCFNQSTGSIEVQVDYGTPPYAYNWSNGEKTNKNVNLKVGNYNLTITDNVGCTRVKSYTLTQPSLLTASAVGSIEMCDNSDGSILVKALGGYPPYVFDIGNGEQGSPEFKNLKGGKEYTVIVTDNNGCKESIKVNVDVTHKPKVEAGINEPIDCIIDTISLDGSQSDQGSGFTNLWTTVAGNIVSGNESLTPDVNKPGMYYLKVTNTNNKCFDIDSVFVIDERVFPDIEATGDTTLNCKLTEITAKGNSNHLPIKYYWKKDGDTIFYSPDKNILISDSGRYLFHVKDTVNLCLSIDTVTIGSDQTKPEAHAKADKDVSCKNSEVIINASSSSQGPNYKYTWSTANGNIISGANTLEPVVNKGGDYKLEVENTNNYCISTASVIVREQTQPVALFEQSINILTAKFSDKSNGIPTIWNWTFGDGGVSDEQNPEHIYTADGEYEVCLAIVNDCGQDKKCQKILVGITAALTLVSWDVNDVSCFGGKDGYIKLIIQGGVPPYVYSWSNQQTTKDIFDLTAGDYSIQITDQQGTKINRVFSVRQPEEILLSNSSITNTSSGKNDGSIQLEITGGTPAYRYLWSNGSTSNPAIDLAAGDYTCKVTDANGCIKDFGPFEIKEITSTENSVIVKNFELIPNPVNDHGFIRIQFDQARLFKLNVVNIYGKSVWSYTSYDVSDVIPIDMSLNTKGMYFIVLSTDSEQRALKCIVTSE